MGILLVIIYGAIVGFLASKIKGFDSGFGLWWDIILGIAGSAFASFITVYGYLFNIIPINYSIGMNLYGIIIDIAGAVMLLYLSRFYNKIFHLANEY